MTWFLVGLWGCPKDAGDKSVPDPHTGCEDDDHTGSPCLPTTETGGDLHTGAVTTTGHTGRVLSTGHTGEPDTATDHTGHTGGPGGHSGIATLGDDEYRIPQNQPLEVPAPGVLDNDPGTPPLTVVSHDPTSLLGGLVAIAPDGELSFVPPPGAALPSTDSFGYRVQDAGGSFFDIFVSVDLTPAVHIVDNTAPGPGTGTAADPFPTLSDAAAVAGPGETLFVRRGDGTIGGLTGATVPPDVIVTGSRVPCTACGDLVEVTDGGPYLGTITVSNGVLMAGVDLAPAAGTDGVVGAGVTGVTLSDVTVTGGDVGARFTGSELTLDGFFDRSGQGVELHSSTLNIPSASLPMMSLEANVMTFAAFRDVREATLTGNTGTFSVALDDATRVALLDNQAAGTFTGTMLCASGLECVLVVDNSGSIDMAPILLTDSDTAAVFSIVGGTGNEVLTLPPTVFGGPVVDLTDYGGTLALNCVGCVGASGHDLVTVTSPAGGTLDLFGSDFTGGGRGVSGVLVGNDVFVAHVDGSTFTNMDGSLIEMNTTGSSTLDVRVLDSTVTGGGGSGVNLGTQDMAILTIQVERSRFEGLAWDPLAWFNFAVGSSYMYGTAHDNTFDGSPTESVSFNHSQIFVNSRGGQTCVSLRRNTTTNTVTPYYDIRLESLLVPTTVYDPVRTGAVTAVDLAAENTAPNTTLTGAGSPVWTNTPCPLPR